MMCAQTMSSYVVDTFDHPGTLAGCAMSSLDTVTPFFCILSRAVLFIPPQSKQKDKSGPTDILCHSSTTDTLHHFVLTMFSFKSKHDSNMYKCFANLNLHRNEKDSKLL